MARNTTVPFQFCCITDDPTGLDDDIRVIPIWDDHAGMGGCYRKVKLFAPEMSELIGPRFINFDIDVVICGNLDKILSRTEKFVIMRDPNSRRQAFNTSMMMMDAGAHAKVWDTFEPAAARRLNIGIGTDQRWAFSVLGGKVPMWDQADGVYSFSNHIQTTAPHLPEGATVVVFHGLRSPSVRNL